MFLFGLAITQRLKGSFHNFYSTTENKNNLIKLRISLEDEVKGGGYGLQAKKLESEILQLEEQIKTSKISKDSIQNILSKIK